MIISVNKTYLDCIGIVNFRSCDAIFGFNNDALWNDHVLNKLSEELNINKGKI